MAVTGHHTMGGLACIKLGGEKQPDKSTCSLTATRPRRLAKAVHCAGCTWQRGPQETEDSGLCELPALQQWKKENGHQT